jgi:hypothetical protein
MAAEASGSGGTHYKHLRVEGTRDGLLTHFVDTDILFESIPEIGTEFMSVLELASRVDMPLVVSFQGVEHISSALIGKLVLVNKKAKSLGVVWKLCQMSPAVVEVFRRILPGDGPPGFGVLPQ